MVLVGIAPIILQEVLQGADSPKRFEQWRREFSGLVNQRLVQHQAHEFGWSIRPWRPIVERGR